MATVGQLALGELGELVSDGGLGPALDRRVATRLRRRVQMEAQALGETEAAAGEDEPTDGGLAAQHAEQLQEEVAMKAAPREDLRVAVAHAGTGAVRADQLGAHEFGAHRARPS